MPPLNLIGILLLIVTALPAADNALTKQEKADGWMLLFDGKTLDSWDSAVPPPASPGQGGAAPPAAQPTGQPAGQAGGPAASAPAVGSNPKACSTPLGLAKAAAGASHWEVVHGLLAPCGEPAGYLTSKSEFKDLILKVDFRTAEDTNSGVFVRSPGGSGGYEVQIWKSQPQGYNTGSIVGTAKTDREYKFVPNQWNHYEITADGDHLVVILNGTKTLDVHDSKFPQGSIRLQYQKYPIEFKNIKIKSIQH